MRSRPKPPLTRSAHVLPFLSLSPLDFERLCLGLIRREGYERAEHVGPMGRDDGCDIVAFCEGRQVAFQCKRYTRLGPKDAEAVVTKIVSLPDSEKTAKVVLVATCGISLEARRRAREKAHPIDLEIWAITELDERVQRHPDLLQQFFNVAPPVKQFGYLCMAPRPHTFVRRREYNLTLNHLLAVVDDRKSRCVPSLIALYGPGGFGKSTLAQALCHNELVQGAYPGGVVWITMGDQLSEGQRLARIRDLLRRFTRAEPPAFETFETAVGYLRDILAGDPVLVVVDDVWSPVDLAAFRNLDPATTLLITTRDQRNIPEGCRAVHVDAMQPEEAIELLGGGFSDFPAARLQDLARRLGEWPLLLSLVHRQIWERVESEGLPAELALNEVEAILAVEGLEAFDRDDLNARELAVAGTVNASLYQLSEVERRCFSKLAIFPEDTDIPLLALERLWGLSSNRTKALCRVFFQLSLVLRFETLVQTIRLHDVIREFLRKAIKNDLKTFHCSFLEACRPAGGWIALPFSEDYLWRHLAYHLEEAGFRDELRQLLITFPWIEAKLKATDISTLLGDYELGTKEPELQLVQGALRLALHALAQRPEELPGQLLGRLLGRSDPGISALLESVTSTRHAPWLRPLDASLTQPGGPLLSTYWFSNSPSPFAVLPRSRLVLADGFNLKVLDLVSGQVLQILRGHRFWIIGIMVLPDGRVVSASRDSTLRVWDPDSGHNVQTLHDRASGGFNGVALLHSGQIVTATGSGHLWIWDLVSNKCVPTIHRHTRKVNSVAVLPDGRAVSGSDDHTVRVWDLISGEIVQTLEGHSDCIADVAVLPDGRVVSASNDCTLRVWDLVSSQCIRTLKGHRGGVLAVAVLPDGSVVSGSSDCDIQIWDVGSGRGLRTLRGHCGSVGSVAILPNGNILSGAGDGTLRVWSLGLEHSLHVRGRLPAGVLAISALSDGRILCSVGDSIIRVWDLVSNKIDTVERGNSDLPRKLVVLANGRVVYHCLEKSLSVLDLESGQILQTLEGHSSSVGDLALLPDDHVVSASNDASLRIWDVASGTTLRILEGHSHGVVSVAVLADGRLISASRDRTLRIWDVTSGETIQVLQGADKWIFALASLPDRQVVSGDQNGYLRVWDLSSGKILKTIHGHSDQIRALGILPGGFLVSGSFDATLRVWDLLSERAVASLTFDAAVADLAVVDGLIVVADGAGGLHRIVLEAFKSEPPSTPLPPN